MISIDTLALSLVMCDFPVMFSEGATFSTYIPKSRPHPLFDKQIKTGRACPISTRALSTSLSHKQTTASNSGSTRKDKLY